MWCFKITCIILAHGHSSQKIFHDQRANYYKNNSFLIISSCFYALLMVENLEYNHGSTYYLLHAQKLRKYILYWQQVIFIGEGIVSQKSSVQDSKYHPALKYFLFMKPFAFKRIELLKQSNFTGNLNAGAHLSEIILEFICLWELFK